MKNGPRRTPFGWNSALSLRCRAMLKYLAGRPLPWLDFLTLLYSEGRGSWIWKTGPAWTVIQVAAAFCPRLDFTFDTFQSFPLFFIGFPFFAWACVATLVFSVLEFCYFPFKFLLFLRPISSLFASKTSSSLLTTSYWCCVHAHMPFPGLTRFEFLFNKIF